ncbi:MAG: phosphate ABC transporter ATP-binding protein [Syntrophomonadaceae bacterium]|nr:phosphate ABC transporter ATP-binding protein [Syntrophomonadaceae bacterium]
MNAVEMSNFSAWYGRKAILDNISISFVNRSITAIVGPSGCGKTTLLRSINRTAEMEYAFSCRGDLQVFGKQVYQIKEVDTVRKQVGMVYQIPLALPLSIRENVLFGPRYHGIREQSRLDYIVEDCLRKVALWDEVKDRQCDAAGRLSGGQKQRLAMARVLAVEPQVLLLDEPCSSLDPASTGLIEELLTSLAEDLCVVIVTHNLFQARRIARQTLFMLDGSVIETGPTDALFSNPLDERTRAFFSGLIG